LSVNLEDVLSADPEKLIEKLNGITKRVAKELQEDIKKEAKVKVKVYEEVQKPSTF